MFHCWNHWRTLWEFQVLELLRGEEQEMPETKMISRRPFLCWSVRPGRGPGDGGEKFLEACCSSL